MTKVNSLLNFSDSNKDYYDFAYPENRTAGIINKIARATLFCCAISWAVISGVAFNHFLTGSALLVAGIAAPIGIAILATLGVLTIAAYFIHSLSSERNTC